jgi:hypothetical protein
MAQRNKCRFLLVPAVFLLCNVATAKDTLFHQRVTWKYDKEGRAWKTAIHDRQTQRSYVLELEPLWAVEGGIIAMEIVVAAPERPDVNLLGERESGVEYPFVITVEELEKGLAKSKFGRSRSFHVGDLTLHAIIEASRLGKGVGSGSTFCSQCPNLQEISIEMTVEN